MKRKRNNYQKQENRTELWCEKMSMSSERGEGAT